MSRPEIARSMCSVPVNKIEDYWNLWFHITCTPVREVLEEGKSRVNSLLDSPTLATSLILLISKIFDFGIIIGAPALSPFSLDAALEPQALDDETPFAMLVDELLPATWLHSTFSRSKVTWSRCGKCMNPTRRISLAIAKGESYVRRLCQLDCGSLTRILIAPVEHKAVGR